MSDHADIEREIWTWMREFVSAPSEFYDFKFAPCPFAKAALNGNTVDVAVWREGDVRPFIKAQTLDMRRTPKLTTRVMVFPPRMQFAWGLTEFIETLNAQVIPDNLFLNTGIAKGTLSKFTGSAAEPYFIVVANSLDAVLKGAESLQKTNFYAKWPKEHYEIVVERRARMAKRYGKKD